MLQKMPHQTSLSFLIKLKLVLQYIECKLWIIGNSPVHSAWIFSHLMSFGVKFTYPRQSLGFYRYVWVSVKYAWWLDGNSSRHQISMRIRISGHTHWGSSQICLISYTTFCKSLWLYYERVCVVASMYVWVCVCWLRALWASRPADGGGFDRLWGESLGRPGEIEGTRCLGPGHARHSEGALSLAVTLRYMQCFSVAAAFVEDKMVRQPACRPPSHSLRAHFDSARIDSIHAPLPIDPDRTF